MKGTVMIYKGGCFCGAVHYEAKGPSIFEGHCHCKDCQKASGAGHITVFAVPTAAMRVTGALTRHVKIGDSGQKITRAFCPVCGSSIYSQPDVMPGATIFRAGTLDDPATIQPQMSIYCASAQPWDPPAADIPAHPAFPPRPPQE